MSHAETREGTEISNKEYRELEQIEEPTPEPRHYRHPINPTLSWCEKSKWSSNTYASGKGGLEPEKVTCVGCLHLYIAKGADWWWKVHTLWYGTPCDVKGHRGCV